MTLVTKNKTISTFKIFFFITKRVPSTTKTFEKHVSKLLLSDMQTFCLTRNANLSLCEAGTPLYQSCCAIKGSLSPGERDKVRGGVFRPSRTYGALESFVRCNSWLFMLAWYIPARASPLSLAAFSFWFNFLRLPRARWDAACSVSRFISRRDLAAVIIYNCVCYQHIITINTWAKAPARRANYYYHDNNLFAFWLCGVRILSHENMHVAHLVINRNYNIN